MQYKFRYFILFSTFAELYLKLSLIQTYTITNSTPTSQLNNKNTEQ